MAEPWQLLLELALAVADPLQQSGCSIALGTSRHRAFLDRFRSEVEAARLAQVVGLVELVAHAEFVAHVDVVVLPEAAGLVQVVRLAEDPGLVAGLCPFEHSASPACTQCRWRPTNRRPDDFLVYS